MAEAGGDGGPRVAEPGLKPKADGPHRDHSRSDPKSLDPKLRDLQSMLRGLEGDNKKSFEDLIEGLKDAGKTSGEEGGLNAEFFEKLSQQLQGREGNDSLNGIVDLLKDEKAREFFEDLGGGLRKLSDLDQRAGGDGDLMPWLKDPNFPKTALDRLGQKSLLDGALGEFAGSPRLKNWISNFQDWRKEADQRLPTSGRPDPARSPSDPSRPDSSSDSNGESVAGATQRRLGELTSARSWSWLKVPNIKISGFASMPRLRAPQLSLSSFSLQGSSLSGLKSGFGVGLILVIPFSLLLIWLFNKLGWLHGLREELTRRAVARRLGAWPIPPLAMSKAEDLRRNVLHLHSVAEELLQPGVSLDHVELARGLARAAPLLAEQAEQLCRDFAPSYYRAPQPELSPEQLRAHGETLEAISQALLSRS